jgi:hypothetical protein
VKLEFVCDLETASQWSWQDELISNRALFTEEFDTWSHRQRTRDIAVDIQGSCYTISKRFTKYSPLRIEFLLVTEIEVLEPRDEFNYADELMMK